MTEQERQIIRSLYDLTIELHNHQGDQIAALRRANDSLLKAHDAIGQMLKLTNDLIRAS